MRRSVSVTFALLLSAGLLAACGGDEEPAEEERPWPLTGLPGYPDGDGRQAVTVKIENTAAGRPQLGIGSADIVVQELVEGGLTRLAVMFHSDYSSEAGPVRSMRETDIGLVLPTDGTLAASGASSSTLAALDSAGVSTAEEGDPGFYRDSGRASPYNVMLDVAELAGTLPDSPPPGPYLPFGPVPEGAVGSPAADLEMRWPGDSTTFGYNTGSGEWTRTDLPDASDFSFTNVVALTVPVTFTGGTDAAGTPIPTMVTTGSGSGWVATGEQVFEVEWSKASNSAAWQLTYATADEAGTSATFALPGGRTWLALLPEDGGSFTSTPPSGTATEDAAP
jgi:hypothetical protein